MMAAFLICDCTFFYRESAEDRWGMVQLFGSAVRGTARTLYWSNELP